MFLKRYHRGVGLVLVSSEASASAIDLGHYQTEVGAQVDEGEGGEERAICHLRGERKHSGKGRPLYKGTCFNPMLIL